jgi:transcriptional regulator with XRE-family HTH domain
MLQSIFILPNIACDGLRPRGSRYEIGKATPPADMLVKLADILDTSVDYILGRTDNRYFNKLNKSDLSDQELELLLIFHKLPQNKKERVMGFLIELGE